jgi:signal transduction histidine kinase
MAEALHLLLVDDDDVDRMAVQRALGAAGVDARYVECGDAACARRALDSGRFDCVFLDLRLPDRDGLDLLRALRAAGDLTPVIMMTGFGDERLAVELMKAGASDYFSKSSLGAERLAQSLRQAVRLRDAEDAATSARLSLRRHADQLRGLAQLSVELHAGQPVESLAALIAEHARGLLSARAAGIVARNVHQLAAEVPRSLPVPATLPKGRGPVAAASLIDDERRLLSSEGSPAREWISAEIPGREDKPAGLIYAIDKASGAFDEGDVAVLAQLAQLASVAFDNAQLVADLQRASRARDDLLAIVSHDLRNPLNVITMASTFQQQLLAVPGGARELLKPAADRIRRASRHMTALVNDLLDASRIESGALQLELKPTPAAELMDEVIEAFAPLANEKGIELWRREGAAGTVEGDRARLFQVFSNLVGNAIKFTPRGGKVSLGSVHKGASVHFDVQDNGPGIAAQHVPMLFDRYWQPRTAASRDGAGLGLFIAKGIVEAHRGAIVVETGVGQGSRFIFTVPAAP